MSSLSNLRLAARLGLAFAALGIGLVAVALTGTLALGGLERDVSKLATTDMQELALVGAMAERTAHAEGPGGRPPLRLRR